MAWLALVNALRLGIPGEILLLVGKYCALTALATGLITEYKADPEFPTRVKNYEAGTSCR